ncbi:MAG: FAD-dependent oxidoreductase [Gammaproteobacteria bacterium]|nr:MAG: FAD-dependent oxidoreductase [Gammaproteobacteria bacterium]
MVSRVTLLPVPDIETDILVVGSGASGLAAALTVALHGGRPLVIERSHLFGGTSATSGGTIWIPNNHLIGPAGGSDSEAEALEYLQTLVGNDATDARIRAFVTEAPRMFRFLDERAGLRCESLPRYCDYHPELPGGKPGWRSCQALPVKADLLGGDFAALQPPHLCTTAFGRINWTAREALPLITQGKGAKSTFLRIALKYWLDVGQRWKTPRDRRLTGGGALIARLMVALRQQGVPVHLSTSLMEFIVEDGRVTGAIVAADGLPQRIRTARGVIVASGGFERNAEMRGRWLPQPTTTAWSAGVPSNTGEPIAAAMRIGVAMHNLDSAWWAPGFKLADEDRARPMFVERALPGSIMVDQGGQRFCNEAASYHVTGGIMARRAASGTAPTWFLFDARYRGKYAIGPLFPGPPRLDARLRPSMRALLRRADSIADLARATGLPAAALEATVARFNSMAQQGRDEDFHRGESLYDRYYGDAAVAPNPSLAPLTRPPFYALPIWPCEIGTNGGILADEFGRALRADGTPLAGLYAAGNCAASPMGRSYPAAGATLGSGMTFGYIAARHALGITA